MLTGQLKNNNRYFYLYMAMPLLLPVAYFFTLNNTAALVIFYIAAFVCVYFDQTVILKGGQQLKPQFSTSAMGIIFFPPLYAFGRARAMQMKKWRWLCAYLAIALATSLMTLEIDDNQSLKGAACALTTSIFNSNDEVTCLVVEH